MFNKLLLDLLFPKLHSSLTPFFSLCWILFVLNSNPSIYLTCMIFFLSFHSESIFILWFRCSLQAAKRWTFFPENLRLFIEEFSPLKLCDFWYTGLVFPFLCICVWNQVGFQVSPIYKQSFSNSYRLGLVVIHTISSCFSKEIIPPPSLKDNFAR